MGQWHYLFLTIHQFLSNISRKGLLQFYRLFLILSMYKSDVTTARNYFFRNSEQTVVISCISAFSKWHDFKTFKLLFSKTATKLD